MAARIFTRGGTVLVSDPMKCFHCRHCLIVSHTFAGRFVGRNMYCNRRDCDERISTNESQGDLNARIIRPDAGTAK